MPAGITKLNPTAVTTDFVNGPFLHIFTVDYISDISAKTGPSSTLQAVLRTIEERNTIYMAGPLIDSNTQQTFAVEAVGGRYPTDTYDGTNSESFATDLQDRIRALVAVDNFNLTTATVTSTKLGILTASAVAI